MWIWRLVGRFDVNWRKLENWKIEKFDRELTLLISGSDSDYESWNRSIISFL